MKVAVTNELAASSTTGRISVNTGVRVTAPNEPSDQRN